MVEWERERKSLPTVPICTTRSAAAIKSILNADAQQYMVIQS